MNHIYSVNRFHVVPDHVAYGNVMMLLVPEVALGRLPASHIPYRGRTPLTVYPFKAHRVELDTLKGIVPELASFFLLVSSELTSA